jgi:hypothetical protein
VGHSLRPAQGKLCPAVLGLWLEPRPAADAAVAGKSARPTQARKKASAALAGGGGQVETWPFYLTAGLKASAKACAFGVPTPVTLSQPFFVWRAAGELQVVPS